jgi:hypothetical protein
VKPGTSSDPGDYARATTGASACGGPPGGRTPACRCPRGAPSAGARDTASRGATGAGCRLGTTAPPAGWASGGGHCGHRLFPQGGARRLSRVLRKCTESRCEGGECRVVGDQCCYGNTDTPRRRDLRPRRPAAGKRVACAAPCARAQLRGDQAPVPHRPADSRLPGVYAVGRRPVTPLERASAAVLACGPGAALSHGSDTLGDRIVRGRWVLMPVVIDDPAKAQEPGSASRTTAIATPTTSQTASPPSASPTSA